MKYAKAGADYPIKIDFVVNGQPVSPSAATITVLKNDQTVAGGVSNASITIPSGATFLYYNIPAIANGMTLEYELRYVNVSFTYGGITYTINDFYVIRNNLNIPVSKDDIRALLSLNAVEMPDEYIDLFSAYVEVQTAVGDTVNLDSLIISGSPLIAQIQLAVKYRAALNSGVFIENMMYQMEQADNTLYRKFEQMDFPALFARLDLGYQQALAALLGDDFTTDFSFFTVVTPPDPVTGEA